MGKFRMRDEVQLSRECCRAPTTLGDSKRLANTLICLFRLYRHPGFLIISTLFTRTMHTHLIPRGVDQ